MKRLAVDAGLQFGLRNHWYPIFESRDLPLGKPIGIRRLGEDLALWRDGSGQPHLFIDRCPHRGAAFSEGGTVQGTELQCWYHGFRYDGSGQCTAVPDLDDGFVVERENQRGVNFDWTEYHDNGSLWFRLEIPYPKTAGPGGPFRILGWSVPIDADTSLSYFLRMRRVHGWQRRLWD